jgi:hypothetical protein
VQTQAHDLEERTRQLQRQDTRGSPSPGAAGENGESSNATATATDTKRAAGRPAAWPAARANPYADAELQPAQVNGFTLQKSFKVGGLLVSSVPRSAGISCCAVLCCAVLCCAVLCCAVLCCAVLCCAVLCCAVLSCAVLCCGNERAVLAMHESPSM